MKRILLSAASLLLTASAILAQEGMWLLHTLKKVNEADMKNMGLNLTADDIYNVNQSSLKDAVCMLSGGSCTAEVVSSQGLVLTNHHCAYGAIQSHSSVENDYLTDGFWAKSFDKELPVAGMTISFLQRIEDVSAQVLANVNPQMPEAERQQKIDAAMMAISKENSKDGLEAQVKSFYHGNEFYMLVYKTYRDIRLVGAPPSSIGKFGGDTDNWMWPRHTGDFSVLRIYAGSDNEPAAYSPDNQPYKTDNYFKVSIAGVKDGDISMVMGYPGSTDRFLTSWGVQQAIDIYNPSVVEVRDLKLKIMKKHMDADASTRIKYASKYAQTANYWKYYIGQTKGLKRLDVFGKKKELEREFSMWAEKDKKRGQYYSEALPLIEKYYKSTNATVKGDVYSLEAGLIGADITLFAFRFSRFFDGYLKAESPEAKKAMIEKYRPQVENHFKNYDSKLDKELFTELTDMYRTNIPKENRPSIFSEIDSKKYKGSVAKYANEIFSRSFLADKTKMMAFLNKPDAKLYNSDPAVAYAKSIFERYSANGSSPAQADFDRGNRIFVEGLRMMQPNKMWYPDANSTMRLSYGKVGDYFPADAMHYDFVTTQKGILEKEDPSNDEFIVPQKLQDLLLKKDFGRYADAKGDLVVNFISANDITGGNSGSPVLNGKGELIGIAFDGNWEAMSGDIAFEPELQRTISVDIRYVLFIMDKYAGAQNLIDEMTIMTR